MLKGKKEPSGKLRRTEFKVIGNAEGGFRETRGGVGGGEWEEFAERIVSSTTRCRAVKV